MPSGIGVCSGVSGVWSVMVSAEEVAVEAANMNPRTPEINLSGGHRLRRFILGKEQIYHASVLSWIVTLSFRQSSGISRLAWGQSTYDVHNEFGILDPLLILF